jgi:transposase-like protein
MDKKTNPYAGHRYPIEINRHEVWFCFRFTLNFRNVEETLAHRGMIVSYEAIR